VLLPWMTLTVRPSCVTSNRLGLDARDELALEVPGAEVPDFRPFGRADLGDATHRDADRST
jgi:hypothetical protein